jgi:hypothetical protein
MRGLRVDMFSTVDGYGSGGPRPAPYWGLRRAGPVRMDPSAAGEERVVLVGATSYRLMSEIAANGDDTTCSRRRSDRR